MITPGQANEEFTPTEDEVLAQIIARARVGEGVYMDGSHLPRPSEVKAAQKFVADHDVRVRREAKAEALREAADAWDDPDEAPRIRSLEEHYRPGGPSMPSIWLRARAGRVEDGVS